MLDFCLMWALPGAVCVGLGLWLVWNTVSKPRAVRRAESVEPGRFQQRYDQQRLLMPWPTFLVQGAIRGGLFALLMLAGTGNVAVVPPFIVFGFVQLYCAEEDRRDKAAMAYNASLISVISYVRNSFRAKPSITEALRAAVQYASGPIADDFKEFLAALETGIARSEAIQAIAEKRQSLFLDGFLETMQAADKIGGGDVNKVLADQQKAIGDQVRIFMEHLVRIEEVRKQVNWAVFGPWAIVAAAHWLPVLLAGMTGGYADTDLTSFYASPLGTGLLVTGAVFGAYMYFVCARGMREGLVLGRIRPRQEATA